MLRKLTDYIFRKRDEWKSDLFKESQKEWHSLLLLAFSVVAVYWDVSDRPADPNIEGTAFVLVGVCGGVDSLLDSVSDIAARKSNTARKHPACASGSLYPAHHPGHRAGNITLRIAVLSPTLGAANL